MACRLATFVMCLLLGSTAALCGFGCDRSRTEPTALPDKEPPSKPHREPDIKSEGAPKTKLALRLAQWKPFPGGEEVKIPMGQEVFAPGSTEMATRLFVRPDAVLTNADVTGTSVDRRLQEDGGIEITRVSIFLTPAGRARFARISRDHVDWVMATFLDDRLGRFATITSEIPDGEIVLAGYFSEAEGKELAQRIAGR